MAQYGTIHHTDTVPNFTTLEDSGELEHACMEIKVYSKPVVLTSTIIQCVIMLLGVSGNCITMVLMLRKQFRRRSYGIFLMTLAVTDSFNLVAELYGHVVITISVMQGCRVINWKSTLSCKLSRYLTNSCILVSSWTLVCMSVERFLVVFFPLRGSIFCRTREAASALFIVIFCILVSQVFHLVMVRVDPVTGECMGDSQNGPLYTALISYLSKGILQFFVPALVIVVLNLSVLFKLRAPMAKFMGGEVIRIGSFKSTNCTAETVLVAGEQNKVQTEVRIPEENCEPEDADNPRNSSLRGSCSRLMDVSGNVRESRRRATCILLVITTTFVVCFLPTTALEFYNEALHRDLNIQIQHMNNTAQEVLNSQFEKVKLTLNVTYLLHCLKSVNYASNFYTYLVFGKSFRKEINSLLFSSTENVPAGNNNLRNHVRHDQLNNFPAQKLKRNHNSALGIGMRPIKMKTRTNVERDHLYPYHSLRIQNRQALQQQTFKNPLQRINNNSVKFKPDNLYEPVHIHNYR